MGVSALENVTRLPTEEDGGLALDRRTPPAWLGRFNDTGFRLLFGRLVVTLETATQREQNKVLKSLQQQHDTAACIHACKFCGE